MRNNLFYQPDLRLGNNESTSSACSKWRACTFRGFDEASEICDRGPLKHSAGYDWPADGPGVHAVADAASLINALDDPWYSSDGGTVMRNVPFANQVDVRFLSTLGLQILLLSLSDVSTVSACSWWP